MEVIREANRADIYKIMMLAEEFQEEAPEEHAWDEEKSLHLIETLINDDNSAILLLEYDKKVVGFLGFTVTQMLFSNRFVATEVAWFVSKEHRGKKGSIKMLKQYEEMCFNAGVDHLVVADIQEVGELSKLYEKLGYKKFETTYMKVR